MFAYCHGVLAFIKNNESLLSLDPTSSLLQSIDHLMPNDHMSNPLVVTKDLENVKYLNTIEIVGDSLWCGCDKGTIYVVDSTTTAWEENLQYHNLSDLIMNRLDVASVSDKKLHAEDNIVELKSLFNSALQKTVIYALHETLEQKSFVISCWLTDQILHRVINLNKEGTRRNFIYNNTRLFLSV